MMAHSGGSTMTDAPNAVLVERYATLTQRKRALEAEIRALGPELSMLEDMLLFSFAEQGIQSIKTASGYTVYLRGQWWARPADGDYDRAIAALQAAGLEEMVKRTVNVQTLSAWVRERRKEDPFAPLPETFDGAIAVTQDFHVLVRA